MFGLFRFPQADHGVLDRCGPSAADILIVAVVHREQTTGRCNPHVQRDLLARLTSSCQPNYRDRRPPLTPLGGVMEEVNP